MNLNKEQADLYKRIIKEICENKKYNYFKLTIYGPNRIGKTHLINAIIPSILYHNGGIGTCIENNGRFRIEKNAAIIYIYEKIGPNNLFYTLDGKIK